MLILTRKAGESITIGDNVQVHILGIKGGQVRIGVEAPRDVPVNREEVFRRKNNQSEEKVSEEGS